MSQRTLNPSGRPETIEAGGRAGMDTPRPLTERQAVILEWIFGETCCKGYQPSYDEIEAAFGFGSGNGLACHLKAIERKGWIKTEWGRSRSIVFLYTPDGNRFHDFIPA